MTTIKFELGKFYRTRDGYKVQIFMLDNGKGFMLCAYFLNESWHELSILKSGKVHDRYAHGLDIVAEWREPIKYSVELWGNEWRQPDALPSYSEHGSPLCGLFGDHIWFNFLEKCKECPIKYRVTVEELPDDSD